MSPKKDGSGLLANAAVYGGIGIVVQAVRLVQAVALRRLLIPEVIGVIGLADLVQSSVKSLDLGIIAAASRELPLLRGAGRSEEEGVVRVTALRSYVAQSAVFAVPVAVYALAAVSDPRIRWALCAAVIIQVLSAACEGEQVVLQSAQKFVGLGRVGLLFALAYAVGVVIGARIFGLAGVLAGGVAAWAAQAFWLRRCGASYGLSEGGRFESKVLAELVRFGLPLRICDYPTALAVLVDSMLVGKLLGLEGLALYATLRSFYNQALELPTRFSSVVLMRLYHNDAGPGRAASAPQLRLFFLVQYLLVLPAIISVVVVGLRLLTSCLLPRYEAVVPLAQVLLLELYFVPQVSLMRNYWIMDKKLGMIAASGSIWLLSRVALLYWLIEVRGLGLSGAAWACLVSAALYHFFLLVTVGRSLWGGIGAVKLGLLVVFSVACTGVVVRQFSAPATPDWMPAIILAARQMTGMTALLSPMLLWGLWEIVRSRRARSA